VGKRFQIGKHERNPMPTLKGEHVDAPVIREGEIKLP